MQTLYEEIAKEARRVGAAKVVLYGSRAREDHRARSDIDLAVYGLKPSKQPQFMEMIESLPTLLDFDVVFVDAGIDAALLENIEKDGVIVMDKLAEKHSKLKNAVSRLDRAIEEYRLAQSDIVRDGVIQRFEFCTELAWKTMREYLLDQGYVEINSPKAMMRQAYADGLIRDENAWISLLNDRNITSHIYDEGTAQRVYERIEGAYAALFCDLLTALK